MRKRNLSKDAWKFKEIDYFEIHGTFRQMTDAELHNIAPRLLPITVQQHLFKTCSDKFCLPLVHKNRLQYSEASTEKSKNKRHISNSLQSMEKWSNCDENCYKKYEEIDDVSNVAVGILDKQLQNKTKMFKLRHTLPKQHVTMAKGHNTLPHVHKASVIKEVVCDESKDLQYFFIDAGYERKIKLHQGAIKACEKFKPKTEDEYETQETEVDIDDDDDDGDDEAYQRYSCKYSKRKFIKEAIIANRAALTKSKEELPIECALDNFHLHQDGNAHLMDKKFYENKSNNSNFNINEHKAREQRYSLPLDANRTRYKTLDAQLNHDRISNEYLIKKAFTLPTNKAHSKQINKSHTKTKLPDSDCRQHQAVYDLLTTEPEYLHRKTKLVELQQELTSRRQPTPLRYTGYKKNVNQFIEKLSNICNLTEEEEPKTSYRLHPGQDDIEQYFNLETKIKNKKKIRQNPNKDTTETAENLCFAAIEVKQYNKKKLLTARTQSCPIIYANQLMLTKTTENEVGPTTIIETIAAQSLSQAKHMINEKTTESESTRDYTCHTATEQRRILNYLPKPARQLHSMEAVHNIESVQHQLYDPQKSWPINKTQARTNTVPLKPLRSYNNNLKNNLFKLKAAEINTTIMEEEEEAGSVENVGAEINI